jgi:UPF0755 protein
VSIELEEFDRAPEPPARRRSVSGRGLATVGVMVGLVLVAYLSVRWLAGAVGELVVGPESTTVAPGIPVTFVVAPGVPASAIGRDLAAAGVIASAADFDREVREARASDRLQAGVYRLETGMSAAAVLEILIAGPGREDYRLTIVEGLTVSQTLESISRQTDIPVDDLVAVLLDGTVTSTLLPRAEPTVRDWEGLLFPDTYEFHAGATAADILGRLARTTEERVADVDWTYLEERGMTPYDGIVIASLIEREVVLDDERPLVASVIFNRLDLEMMLQIDATVVYALGGVPEGGLTRAHLDVDSPYNTYRNHGLPPTPISGVRRASLEAAAAPADTPYLFYLLTGDDGSHSFTDDFDEFLRWQQEGTGTG